MPYVDVHCHLLPGLDDGAARLEDSLAHARRLAADGVREVVCTPHIKRSEFPAVAIGEIAARTRAVQRALADAGLRVRLHTGGELAHPDALVLTPRDLALVAQGPPGGRWVLLECPFAGFDAAFADACRRLGALGYGIVLAHPERAGGLVAGGLGTLRALLRDGALAQVSVCSLVGAHGPAVQHIARRLVAGGLAFCVASDGHPGSRDQTLRRGRDALVRGGMSVARARRLTEVAPGLLLRVGVRRMAARAASAGRAVSASATAA